MSNKDIKRKFSLLGFIQLAIAVFIILLCNGCGSSDIEIAIEDNDEVLENFITEPSTNRLNKEAGTIFYCDASAVLLDAQKNSKIYKAMRSQMNQYIETLTFINGTEFDTIECDKSEQKIHDALDDVSRKAKDANIQAAIDHICKGDRQSMIITDFEFVKNSGECYDTDPYLSGAFIKWLSKGFQIDFLIEPYMEGTNLKKRFYVFFTDPCDESPISKTMLSQVESYIVKSDPKIGECCLFTLNASDYGIISDGKNSCSDEIDLEEITTKHIHTSNYSISDSWNDIKENVMKLDKHDEIIEDETPIPLFDNLKIIQGKNYSIKSVKIQATNISKNYLKKAGEEIENSDEIWDISDAFHTEISSDDKIKVFLNKKIFEDKHLYSVDDGFSGNLIRLDFYVDQYEINNYDSSILEWTSCRTKTKGETANCVSLSIDNALKDVKIAPSSERHKLLYTIFLQTESK